MARKVAIVGVADTPLKDGVAAEGGTVLQIQARAARAALDEAGLTLDDVDALFAAGAWGIPGPGVFVTSTLAEYLGIRPGYMDGTQIGGSSFEAHVGHAAAAIAQGACEVALVLYGSTQKSDASRTLGARGAMLNSQYEAPYGLPSPVGAYAMAAMRHRHVHGSTPEQLAEIAVATRKWAALNPAATMRDPLSVDEVLKSPMICDPLRLRDCCLITDGGGAIVLTSLERARDLKQEPVVIAGFGAALSHWGISQMPDLAWLAHAAESGRRAMAMAGIGPRDIDVVEIYDSFTITVLMSLEALGFCGRGEGGAFVSGQRTAPGGEFPLNTNGGGLSYCHPGMYGLFLLTEATRQLRGACGPRQVKDAEVALAHGTGGVLSTAATCILTRA
ncbi:MAG TPA: acetyl-CoA acetyltransferase [Stellaceae bacterium]|nr:acetyl-CoA acetyltransferase [Stellaceae bacterium]